MPTCLQYPVHANNILSIAVAHGNVWDIQRDKLHLDLIFQGPYNWRISSDKASSGKGSHIMAQFDGDPVRQQNTDYYGDL